jgi:uncharacterized membrane-anchored protein
MKRQNLPVVDDRYWVAILLASITGTALGDFVSTGVHFGYGGGLIPLLVLYALVLVAERRATVPSEGYYWTAIVFTRATATDMGDLVTRGFAFGYAPVAAVVVPLAVLFFWWSRRAAASSQATLAGDEVASGSNTPRSSKALPPVDARYWLTIFIVSTTGTVLGDLASDTLGGVGIASLVLGVVLAAAVAVVRRAKAQNEARYWTTILATRTTGTCMGDFITGGLKLGYGWGALYVAMLLVYVLDAFPRSTSLPRAERAADFATSEQANLAGAGERQRAA